MLRGAFVLLENVVIVNGEFRVHGRNRFWQLGNELSRSTTVDSEGGHDCVGWYHRVVQDLRVVVDLYAVADHTVLADLHIVANFVCADHALLIDIDIVTDDHLCVAEAALLLDVTRPYDTLFTNNCIDAHRYLREVATKNRTCLNNGLSINEDLFGTFDEHLPADLVAFRGDEEPFLVVEKGVLLDHHLYQDYII